DKSKAHRTLTKCLEHLSSSSKPELQTISANVMETLKCKKNINAFWASKKREKKKNNLEERIQIVERESKLHDVKQHATAKKLIFEQDNNVRKNFNAEILEKRNNIRDMEEDKSVPSIPKSRKRKVEDLPENKNSKMRLLEHQPESELEDNENKLCDDEYDEDDEDDENDDQDSDSDAESINGDKGEEEIKTLTQDEVIVRNKLIKILTARQKKDKKAGKDFMTSIYLNGIIDLSDNEMQKRIKKSLNEEQNSWLERVLEKKAWKPTPACIQYLNQFTEEVCNRNEIPTIVRKSCVTGRFDPFYHEAHEIAQQILTHCSVRLEAPMRVEYKGLNLERTYAVDTIIYFFNRLFRMHQDELDVAWIESQTSDTKKHKFDGLYKVIKAVDKSQAIIIIEFSRGRKTPTSKKYDDQVKMCRNSMRTLNKLLQTVPKNLARVYLVQSFNGFIEIKYLVRPLPTIYVLQQFLRIKIPVTFADFEQFSKDIICLMDWQTDVLSTARAVNKASTNAMENNNVYITSVDNTPQKKKAEKAEPEAKNAKLIKQVMEENAKREAKNVELKARIVGLEQIAELKDRITKLEQKPGNFQ
ncbi:1750_t:CDS:10, partial [Paraglomus occultum]